MSTTASNSPAELLRDKVTALCESLTAIQQRNLARLADVDASITTLSHGRALWWWIADVLQRAPLTDSEQRWIVLETFETEILAYGDQLFRSLEGRAPREVTGYLPTAQLGIADRRYVALTGCNDVLDITTGEKVPGAKLRFFERVSYDLATLYLRRLDAYLETTASA